MRRAVMMTGVAVGAVLAAALPPVAAFAAEPAAAGDDADRGRDRRHRQEARRGARRDPAEPRREQVHVRPRRRSTSSRSGAGSWAGAGAAHRPPASSQDSDDEIHVRNEHGNVQYRLNGVIIPESISGFGQTIDTRIAAVGVAADRHAAGAVRLPHRRRRRHHGPRPAPSTSTATSISTAASHGRIEPSFTLKDASGGLNYFVSVSYLQNDLGIENPTPAREAIHDRTAAVPRLRLPVAAAVRHQPADARSAAPRSAASRSRTIRARRPAFTVNGRVELRFGAARPEPARVHPLRRRRVPVFGRSGQRPGRAVHPLFADQLRARPERRRHHLQRLFRRLAPVEPRLRHPGRRVRQDRRAPHAARRAVLPERADAVAGHLARAAGRR